MEAAAGAGAGGARCKLYVTHAAGEGPFVRLAGQPDRAQLARLEQAVQAAAGAGRARAALPLATGAVCLAPHADGRWYRAQVTEAAGGVLGVRYLDYGMRGAVSAASVLPLEEGSPLRQVPLMAGEYLLARLVTPAGRWERPAEERLRAELCYAEYDCTVVAAAPGGRQIVALTLPDGSDQAERLAAQGLGALVSTEEYTSYVLKFLGESVTPMYRVPDGPLDHPELVPFSANRHLPMNPAATMRMHGHSGVPLDARYLQTAIKSPPTQPVAPSPISQRLLVHSSAPRNISNLKPLSRPAFVTPRTATVQPERVPGESPAHAPAATPSSPKKTMTYKNRLLEIGSQHEVVVTFASDGPESFAVQLLCNIKKLDAMTNDINRRPHSSLSEPPMIGSVCLGKMSGDRTICRAIVVNMSGMHCNLFFVDFGDTEMVAYYDIFDIPDEFLKHETFALRFCLSGIKQLKPGAMLNEAFRRLVEGKHVTLRVVAPEGPPLIQYGEVYVDGKSVLGILKEEMVGSLEFTFMEVLPAGVKRSVLVSYVDSCVKFFVQLTENTDALNDVMAAVEAHCESSNPLNASELRQGMACCALFPDDKAWYRAQVLSVNGDKAVVWYVDYGNEQEVDVKDLRSITVDLVELPAQALKCALKGYEDKPVESKTSNQLEMLALEKSLKAHVVGVLSHTIMLVTLVDESQTPPLDVARRMMQLSAPRQSRSTPEVKPAVDTKESPESMVSSPEGSIKSEKNRFRSDKLFREDRRKDSGDDFSQRGGSFRGRNDRVNKQGFDRSALGRHSEKYPKKERQGGKPWDRNQENPSAATDEWGDTNGQGGRPGARERRKPKTGDSDDKSTKQSWKHKSDHSKWPRQGNDGNSSETSSQQSDQQRTNAHSVQHRLRRDNFTKPESSDNKGWGDRRNNREKDSWGEKRDNRGDKEGWGEKKSFGNRNDNRGEKKENWGEKKDNWGEKKDNWDGKKNYQDNRGERSERSNFTPRDRGERAFDGNKSFGSNKSDSYKSRGKFSQPKELPNPVPIDKQYSNHEIEAASQQEVSIAWFISPESFYAQITSLQATFVEMMNKIPEMYKGVKPFNGTIGVGSSILARFPEDGVLYRAMVMGVQPFGKYIVQYIDFGNKFVVDSKDIWQLDEELMALPKMAVHCSLTGVKPLEAEWKTSRDMDLCFNAPRYQCVFQECIDEKYKVSLWNNGVSVAEQLAEKNLAALSEQSSITLKDEPIDLSIIVGQQMICRVTHVESFDNFYIQLDLEKAATVQSIIEKMDPSALQQLPPESAAAGTHCTVKHEGKLHRAIVNEATESQVTVVLPDYGYSITTAPANLCVLPTELSVYYYQSLQCRLNNYTKSGSKLMSAEELAAKLQGNKFIIYINHVDGICLVTTLYELSTGEKVAMFEPDEGAFDEVIPLCARAVYNYSFGTAYVTHTASLAEVYLQREADGDRIALLLDALFKFYEEGTPESLESYEAEMLCAAKSSDSNWYRATILNITESECNIQFVDYGNTETVPKESIKKLDPKFHEPYTLALVVSLGLTTLTDDAITKFTEITVDKEVLVTLTIGADGWLSNLHLDGEDLALKLVSEKLAAPQGVTAEEHQETTVQEEPVSLPPGTIQVYISHIDSPGQFWLQMADGVDKIDEIQAELQENYSTYEDIDNKDMGTLCVAKYSADDQWYRAEILDADADITTVRFIDYGNTDVLDNVPEVMKVIPDHLKLPERFAIKSSINAVPTGTGQWSEPASDCFTGLVGDTSQPINALIVLKDITTYVDLFVNGQNITDKVVHEGHATRSEETECGDLASCFASHVNSPSEFWIQLENSTSDLQAVEAAMADSESFPELSEKEEGLICAAKYPEDGCWYRAQIIVDGSEGTEVLFMDYGNASIATELRNLPEDLKAKPALSRKCALQKPRDIKSWSRKSEVKFNELAAEGATIFNIQFIASGDISIVDLYLEGKSVTEELASLCEHPPQTERPAPLGQDIRSNGVVCYVDKPQDFYIRLEESNDKLDMITERLLSAKDFEAAGDLKVGSTFVALWSEDINWYRARVIEFCDVGAHVLFMDYGNKAKCEEFRQMPVDLVDIEPLAKNCALVGLQETDEKAKERFQVLVANDALLQVEFLDTSKEPRLVRLLLGTEDVGNLIIKPDESSSQVMTEPPAENVEFHEKLLESSVNEESITSENIERNENKDEIHDNGLVETSKVDLDESIGSNETVIENKSNEEQQLDVEEFPVGQETNITPVTPKKDESVSMESSTNVSPKKSSVSPKKNLSNSSTPLLSPNKNLSNSSTPLLSPNKNLSNSSTPLLSPNKNLSNSSTPLLSPNKNLSDSSTPLLSPNKNLSNSSTPLLSPNKNLSNSSTPLLSPNKNLSNSSTPLLSPNKNLSDSSTPLLSPNKNLSNSSTPLLSPNKNLSNSSTPLLSPNKNLSNSSTPLLSPNKNLSNFSTPLLSPNKNLSNSSTPLVSPNKNFTISSTPSVSPKKNSSNGSSPLVSSKKNSSNVSSTSVSPQKKSPNAYATSVSPKKNSSNTSSTSASPQKSSSNASSTSVSPKISPSYASSPVKEEKPASDINTPTDSPKKCTLDSGSPVKPSKSQLDNLEPVNETSDDNINEDVNPEVETNNAKTSDEIIEDFDIKHIKSVENFEDAETVETDSKMKEKVEDPANIGDTVVTTSEVSIVTEKSEEIHHVPTDETKTLDGDEI